MNRYSELQSIVLWDGAGVGRHFQADFEGDIGSFVNDQVKEAMRIRHDRRQESSVHAVVKSLQGRGIEIMDHLPGCDNNDLIGLIGEILTNDFIVDRGVEPILPKWQYTGTSKSGGIDIVGREKLGDVWELMLYEAKHLHEEIRNKKTECCALIRARFKMGIIEFEDEKTKFNLAKILIQLGTFIRIGEAMGSDVDLAREQLDFISLSLKNDHYRVNVVAIVDIECCDELTFEQSVSQISNPIEVIKNHPAQLNLITAKSLERATDKVCEDFAGIL